MKWKFSNESRWQEVVNKIELHKKYEQKIKDRRYEFDLINARLVEDKRVDILKDCEFFFN